MSIHKKVLLGKKEMLEHQEKINDKFREEVLGIGAIIDVELQMIVEKLGIHGVESFKKSITQRVYDAISSDARFIATQNEDNSQELAELLNELEEKTHAVRMAKL